MNDLEDRLARIRQMSERAKARAAEIARGLPPLPKSGEDIRADHPIARAIGLEQAKAIFGPKKPTAAQTRAASRKAYIAERLAAGASLTDIAKELSITPQRVGQVRKELRS